MSVEHPDLPPVFGTTCPPRGLSGLLRATAFRYGEGRLAHWMTLLLADRVDVVEGMIEDAVADPQRRRDLLIAGGVLALVGAGVILANARRKA